MVFLADLHIHSKFSKDGFADPKEIINSCKKKGIYVVSITDHNCCSAYYESFEMAEKLDILLIPGSEVKTNKGDLIIYGPLEKIEKILEFVKLDKDYWKITQFAKKEKLKIVLPHPFALIFHFNSSFMQHSKNIIEIVDGVEIFNSRTLFWNHKALKLAKKYKKFCLSNSDAHLIEEIGNALTVFNGEKPENINEFFKILETSIKNSPNFVMKRIFFSQYAKWKAKLIKERMIKKIIDF